MAILFFFFFFFFFLLVFVHFLYGFSSWLCDSSFLWDLLFFFSPGLMLFVSNRRRSVVVLLEMELRWMAQRMRLLLPVGDQVTFEGEFHAAAAHQRLPAELLVVSQIHLDIKALPALTARVRLLSF